MSTRVAALALALAAVLAAPGSAAAATETASAGSITAVLSWTEREDGPPYAEDQRLVIEDAGSVIVDERIPDKRFLTPAGLLLDRPSLRAEDFDRDGVVEVVLDEYTGGAHCCFDAWIYHGAEKTVHHFGDAAYRFRDVDGDGSSEFLSADPAFAGAFTSFAASQFPIQVWDWRDDELVDVTRSEAVRPRVVAQSKRFKARYQRARDRGSVARGDDERVRSSLAAWAATLCLLDRCPAAKERLARAAERGVVRRGFPKQVRRFLKRLGYWG